jgi:hypothetical protein
MSGDWIKMRKSLAGDPRVVRMMSALKADRFRTIGGLFSAWCLLDEQTEDGLLENYTPQIFDDFVGFQGLANAMILVGWLEESPQGLVAVNFTEHNGQTAKRRAQDSVRKMSAREADKTRTKPGQNPDQRREEKRIVEKREKKSHLARGAKNSHVPSTPNSSKGSGMLIRLGDDSERSKPTPLGKRRFERRTRKRSSGKRPSTPQAIAGVASFLVCRRRG